MVHKSLSEGCPNSKQEYQTQSGIKNFIPKLKTPILEVPTAYNSNFWKSNNVKTKKSNNTSCSGQLSNSQQGSFDIGFKYLFKTSGHLFQG